MDWPGLEPWPLDATETSDNVMGLIIGPFRSYVHLTFLKLTFFTFLLSRTVVYKTPRNRHVAILQRGHHHCFIKTIFILILVRDQRFFYV